MDSLKQEQQTLRAEVAKAFRVQPRILGEARSRHARLSGDSPTERAEDVRRRLERFPFTAATYEQAAACASLTLGLSGIPHGTNISVGPHVTVDLLVDDVAVECSSLRPGRTFPHRLASLSALPGIRAIVLLESMQALTPVGQANLTAGLAACTVPVVTACAVHLLPAPIGAKKSALKKKAGFGGNQRKAGAR